MWEGRKSRNSALAPWPSRLPPRSFFHVSIKNGADSYLGLPFGGIQKEKLLQIIHDTFQSASGEWQGPTFSKVGKRTLIGCLVFLAFLNYHVIYSFS